MSDNYVQRKTLFALSAISLSLSLAFSVAYAQTEPQNTMAQGEVNSEALESKKPAVTSAAEAPLPNPLVLNAVLAKYSQQAPEIEIQKAKLDMALSTKDQNQVSNNLELNLQGRLARREFGEEAQPLNQFALHVGKVLYDFGRSDKQLSVDQKRVEKEQHWLETAKNRQKIALTRAYFEVLLADFQYRIDNEAMAIDYIRFDKTQDLHAVGQRSDVDFLQAEHGYQQSLLKRMQSEQAQLKTRVELANVMSRPNARPDELKLPNLSAFKARKIKGVELQSLQGQAIDNNSQSISFRKAIESQQANLQKAQASSSPTLRTDAWVGQLSSQPDIREGRWKAQVTLDVPLYDGGSEQAAVANAKAQLAKTQAEATRWHQQLRSRVADIYFQLKLLDTEKKVHQAFGDYADLYLDFSRALYENESQTDLGDSFVRLSEANYNMVEFEFKQALLWMELDYLLGKSVGLDLDKQSSFIAKTEDPKKAR